jgi:hypothetical protein
VHITGRPIGVERLPRGVVNACDSLSARLTTKLAQSANEYPWSAWRLTNAFTASKREGPIHSIRMPALCSTRSSTRSATGVLARAFANVTDSDTT